jgi:hypothetical protein
MTVRELINLLNIDEKESLLKQRGEDYNFYRIVNSRLWGVYFVALIARFPIVLVEYYILFPLKIKRIRRETERDDLS